MSHVFLPANTRGAQPSSYDFASEQVDTVKHLFVTLSDEHILGLYEDARTITSDAGYMAAQALKSTLYAAPYLDGDRAMELYDRALEAESIEGNAVFIPHGLQHLTRAVGDRAVTLVQRAYNYDQTVTPMMEITGQILDSADEFPLSEWGRAELREA